ncbi:hypothetical protein [Sporolactobacillus laevolacticus]|uniref:hypothetical protein n=1 Tax=Sporolactobacillus laevolacticus TaxID=33018 RepID=UPI0025B52719|nr:hypothetical protein [Sporolactobacillus laevolacticus]MDN3956184.1 hypothetical protein [Sporolactobacillus laevolacticus]
MATFDMSSYENEPLVFKNLYGEDYTIPADMPLEFILKIGNLQKKVEKIKDEKKQAEVMFELVTIILNLDESQQITVDEVRKFDFKYMVVIINETMKQINSIDQNPNLNLPSSN